MKGARLEAFARDMEAQGARTRKTKKGLMIYAPDGSTLTIHTTYGNQRALVNDITWFRRHGLVHPEDKKENEVAKKAETNEEGYPLYVVSPINGSTRKRVLSELEAKGWPLRLRPTELNMDTVTAARALYNVGYRWDMDSPPKRRVWVAPDDIREMHERVKAEMARREQEQKDARIAAHKVVEVATVATEEVMKKPRIVPTLEEIRSQPLPSLDFVKPVGHEGEHFAVRNPDVVASEDDDGIVVAGKMPSLAPPPEKPEREFIDSVDSWTVDATDLPPLMTVSDLIWTLQASGLEVEVRVWRAQ